MDILMDRNIIANSFKICKPYSKWQITVNVANHNWHGFPCIVCQHKEFRGGKLAKMLETSHQVPLPKSHWPPSFRAARGKTGWPCSVPCRSKVNKHTPYTSGSEEK